MVRAGLGSGWSCTFANDINEMKGRVYKQNWGSDAFELCDVAELTVDDLGEHADLSWASFPCQDLSLAGNGAGLAGERSSAFQAFWNLVLRQVELGRAPKIVVLENVMGAVTSHGGQDFTTLCEAYSEADYIFGAFSLDAIHFVPQSRKRLFFVGIHKSVPFDRMTTSAKALSEIHTKSIVEAHQVLPSEVKENWVWWNLPRLPRAKNNLKRFVGPQDDESEIWHSDEQTCHLVSLMDDNNRKKLLDAQLSTQESVGTIYRRMRKDAEGRSVQRAEIRFDGVSGCLRVPIGGSSKQTLMFVRGESIRSRLMSPRETASLMGLPDNFVLPESATDCYHLTGDGVAVPIVDFLRRNLFERLLQFEKTLSVIALREPLEDKANAVENMPIPEVPYSMVSR